MSSSTENELMQVTPPDIQSSNFHTDFHSDSESFHNSVCEALPTQDPSSSHDIANKSKNLEDLLKNLRNQKTSQHCKNLIGSICASYPHCLQEAEGEARGLPLLVHTAVCDSLWFSNIWSCVENSSACSTNIRRGYNCLSNVFSCRRFATLWWKKTSIWRIIWKTFNRTLMLCEMKTKVWNEIKPMSATPLNRAKISMGLTAMKTHLRRQL